MSHPNVRMQFTESDVVLFTCSYEPDREIFFELCRSIETHAPKFTHVTAVPRQDMVAFSKLATSRRHFVAQEDYIPPAAWRVPMPPPVWRRRLGLPRHDQFWFPPFRRVGGWVMQQIVKLEAARKLEQEIIVHLDSDTALFRDLTIDHLVQGENVRLFRQQRGVSHPGHQAWATECADLLGLEPSQRPDRNYVSWPVIWRRSIVENLKNYIERSGHEWRITLSRMNWLSEYHLYGLFAEFLEGDNKKNIYFENDLMLSRTFFDNNKDDFSLSEVDQEIRAWHVGCCLQSTLDYPIASRRAFVEALRRHASAADAHSVAGSAGSTP